MRLQKRLVLSNMNIGRESRLIPCMIDITENALREVLCIQQRFTSGAFRMFFSPICHVAVLLSGCAMKQVPLHN